MSLSDPVADTSSSAALLPEALVEIARYPTASAGFDHGLVVLAQGRPFWLIPADGSYGLRVEAIEADRLREQLARFDRESLHWPPAPPVAVEYEFDLLGPLVWAVMVLAIFRAQLQWPAITARGALDAQAVFQGGEAWRALTALFLHADAEHVLSNLLSGLLAFTALGVTFGRARGWLLLALSSVLANLAVAAVNYPGPYRSLGASTAIFAALGLLTGRAVRAMVGTRPSFRWRSIALPLASGFTVLGLYGAGGQHVDVGAHLIGFLSGFGFGFAIAAAAKA